MPQATPGPWVERWLSPARFSRYLAECGGDRAKAMATYEWNLRLSHSMLRDIAHFEVAMRNAYDGVIAARWNGPAHWLLDPASPVLTPLMRRSHRRLVDINDHNRRSIRDAIGATGGANATSGAVIAELQFGFWRHLADAGHERTVWIPYVYYAWPSGTSRAQIYNATALINDARNRAAHHEPLFGGAPGRGVLHTQRQLVGLLQLLLPDLADYVQQTSTVAKVLAERP